MWAKPELGGRFADMRGLVGIERAGQSGLDVAERAGARAGVAHDHEGGVLFLPALADIRAAGLLAHGDEAVVAHDLLRGEIARRHRRLDADPVRFLLQRRIRPVRLFRMARARAVDVVDDGHALYLRLARPAPQGQALRMARQIARNTMAPMVATIRLPQKSGITSRWSFSNRKPPTMAPMRPTAEVMKNAARAAEDDFGQPARDQADDDPTENTHRFSSKSFSVTYSTRDHTHRAPLPSSSPTASDAGRWCASILLPWFPNSSPPRNPGSVR